MKWMRNVVAVAALSAIAALLSLPARAQDNGSSQPSMSRFERLRRLRHILENQRENRADVVTEESLGAHTQDLIDDTYGGRAMILYVPSRLPPPGTRAMVVALHGGMGSAKFVQEHLKMDGIAEKYGFIVAYLNGSRASDRLSDRFHAWDAGGGCCGAPYTDKVDDIGYISGAVHYLEHKYGIDPARVFGTGHSNGAIMTQTLMCETNLYQKAVSLAGSLMADVAGCPDARGKTILAVHGKSDQNVPPEGGRGTEGVTNISYRSEADSQARFEDAGGTYDILLVASDHSLEHIAAAIRKSEGISLAEKEARFFGLAR